MHSSLVNANYITFLHAAVFSPHDDIACRSALSSSGNVQASTGSFGEDFHTDSLLLIHQIRFMRNA